MTTLDYSSRISNISRNISESSNLTQNIQMLVDQAIQDRLEEEKQKEEKINNNETQNINSMLAATNEDTGFADFEPIATTNINSTGFEITTLVDILQKTNNPPTWRVAAG